MNQFEYPEGPAQVPENLTRPNGVYRQRAWLAMLGLGAFIAVYAALAGWFAWTAYRLLIGLNGKMDFFALGAGVCAAFLFVFMIKALFFIQRGGSNKEMEVTKEQHPQLFAFLHRLADEAGAPRPHRVFLSNTVNACVFYDLSVLNLLFPSRKNLEVGLPLVNVLTAAEFKAVLAHEFGHFAQRTMAIGTWVYIAQQIASQVIARRDALDKFLKQLSRIDLRIGWIGWGLQLIVWSIRSLLDTVFRFVLLAQRALSRQMEFQADLVAVSLTGSDALVHALHKLRAADDAWDRTLSFANSRLQEKKSIEDLFAVQSEIIERMAQILDDPLYGRVPPCEGDPAAHRVFQTELASTPRMWSTHPASADREDNAKRAYISAPLDDRSAWEMFDDPNKLRRHASAEVFDGIEAEIEPQEATLTALEQYYDRADLNSRYRGAYLGRSVVRCAASVKQLFNPPVSADALVTELSELYPNSLAADLKLLKNLEIERHQLEAIRDGFLEAPNKLINFRDRQLKKSQLPSVIAEVAEELEQARARVWEHDRRCRSVHLAAAGKVGGGWAPYLVGLTKALHYADHQEANLRDAQGILHNVLAIVTADRHVSRAELKRLLAAANVLHDVMHDIYAQVDEVVLDTALLEAIGAPSWREAMGLLELPPATDENVNDWMRVIDGWVDSTASPLATLRAEALDLLLKTEQRVAQWMPGGGAPESAPTPSKVPAEYPILVPGDERERQKKLDIWDRFQTAEGFFPATARLLVAGSIVGAVLGFSGRVGMNEITVYNGLATEVDIRLGGEALALQPFASEQVTVPVDVSMQVQAWSDGALIENFVPTTSQYPDEYVYNVAGASPLLRWTAVYGEAPEYDDVYYGAERWMKPSAQILFKEPPEQIKMKGKGDVRHVLAGFGELSPQAIAQLLPENKQDQFGDITAMHLRWDDTNSENYLFWYSAASAVLDNSAEIINERLQRDPNDVMNLRLQYAGLDETQAEQWCTAMRQRAAAAPEDADIQYIVTRCEEAGQTRDQRYLTLSEKWPAHPWIALSRAYVADGRKDYETARIGFSRATKVLPAVRVYVNVEQARLRRLMAGSTDVDIADLVAGSTHLAYLQAEELEPEMVAHQQLVMGKKISLMPDDPQERARLIWMQGASVGATSAQIRNALEQGPQQGIDRDTVVLATALALRYGDNAEIYAQQLGDYYNEEEVAALLSFLTAVHRGDDVATAEQYLDGADLGIRGHAYAAALVLRQDSATRTWQRDAGLMLFTRERPFLG